MKWVLLGLLLIAPLPAMAQIQSDCRGQGSIGTAVMAPDGTITLSLYAADGSGTARAFSRSDPDYARILSHLGGMRPGEHKNVPPFCSTGGN